MPANGTMQFIYWYWHQLASSHPCHALRNVTESCVTACGEIKDASPGAFSPAEQWPGNRKYLMHGQGLVPGPGQAPVSGLVSGPVYETIVQSDARKPIITPVVAYSIQAVPHTKVSVRSTCRFMLAQMMKEVGIWGH